ncbi:transposase [Rhizobium sp. BR 362]|uniref:transposase n=1 Tax=Rhizobium sp. BR 362 TaxID=3040670 RepID=UPI003FA6E1DD
MNHALGQFSTWSAVFALSLPTAWVARLAFVASTGDRAPPATARQSIRKADFDCPLATFGPHRPVALTHQIEAYTSEIVKLEKHIVRETRQDPTLSRLTSVQGVGPITASSIAAFVPDPQAFKSGRHFAAWIGLTPKSNSTGWENQIGKNLKNGKPGLTISFGCGGVRRYPARASRRKGLSLVD